MKAWWRRWLGVEALEEQVRHLEGQILRMEGELSVYRRYLHEAVVAEPGREILLSWRRPADPDPVLPPELPPDLLPPTKYSFWSR
jgi:hypothetical protein